MHAVCEWEGGVCLRAGLKFSCALWRLFRGTQKAAYNCFLCCSTLWRIIVFWRGAGGHLQIPFSVRRPAVCCSYSALCWKNNSFPFPPAVYHALAIYCTIYLLSSVLAASLFHKVSSYALFVCCQPAYVCIPISLPIHILSFSVLFTLLCSAVPHVSYLLYYSMNLLIHSSSCEFLIFLSTFLFPNTSVSGSFHPVVCLQDLLYFNPAYWSNSVWHHVMAIYAFIPLDSTIDSWLVGNMESLNCNSSALNLTRMS